MLILSRKVHEAITIGQDIEVKIISLEGDRISLGIEAPKDIPIYRNEALESYRNPKCHCHCSKSSRQKKSNP